MIHRYIILKAALTMSFLINTQPAVSSYESDLPSIKITTYSGKGSHNADSLNLRSAYRQAPLLGILYSPEGNRDNTDQLTTFYEQYSHRDKYFLVDEKVASSCQCLFMTAEPNINLQETISMIKPLGAFFLASDNGELLRHLKLNSKQAWLILYRNGRLLWKEAIGEDGSIPHF